MPKHFLPVGKIVNSGANYPAANAKHAVRYSNYPASGTNDSGEHAKNSLPCAKMYTSDAMAVVADAMTVISCSNNILSDANLSSLSTMNITSETMNFDTGKFLFPEEKYGSYLV